MRSEFGMSAHEVWNEVPAWEIDALLQERERVIREANKQK